MPKSATVLVRGQRFRVRMVNLGFGGLQLSRFRIGLALDRPEFDELSSVGPP